MDLTKLLSSLNLNIPNLINQASTQNGKNDGQNNQTNLNLQTLLQTLLPILLSNQGQNLLGQILSLLLGQNQNNQGSSQINLDSFFSGFNKSQQKNSDQEKSQNFVDDDFLKNYIVLE